MRVGDRNGVQTLPSEDGTGTTIYNSEELANGVVAVEVENGKVVAYGQKRTAGDHPVVDRTTLDTPQSISEFIEAKADKLDRGVREVMKAMVVNRYSRSDVSSIRPDAPSHSNSTHLSV